MELESWNTTSGTHPLQDRSTVGKSTSRYWFVRRKNLWPFPLKGDANIEMDKKAVHYRDYNYIEVYKRREYKHT